MLGLESKDKLFTDPTEIAKIFNDQFLQVPDTNFNSEINFELLKKYRSASTNSLFIAPTIPSEIQDCINRLNNSGSIDYFGFNTKMIQKTGSLLCPTKHKRRIQWRKSLLKICRPMSPLQIWRSRHVPSAPIGKSATGYDVYA